MASTPAVAGRGPVSGRDCADASVWRLLSWCFLGNPAVAGWSSRRSIWWSQKSEEGRRVAIELGVPRAELALQYLSSSASDPAAEEASEAAPPADRRNGSMPDWIPARAP
jgi:hypothetical protein